ncbi:MAG: hypothetical protein M3021_10095 [Actinomycetota bacterium]|nr:hypothetical protein [Actinomycetota bacterium]
MPPRCRDGRGHCAIAELERHRGFLAWSRSRPGHGQPDHCGDRNPGTTSTLAYLDAFKAFGISRVGLVSPYTQDVNDAIIRSYRTEGMTITGERHLGLSINEYFARVEPSELLAPSAELADGSGNSRPQALIYLCTNL